MREALIVTGRAVGVVVCQRVNKVRGCIFVVDDVAIMIGIAPSIELRIASALALTEGQRVGSLSSGV